VRDMLTPCEYRAADRPRALTTTSSDTGIYGDAGNRETI
jgi:hypothetical protein